MRSAEPNIRNRIHPMLFINAAVLKTADQLAVNSNMCPAK